MLASFEGDISLYQATVGKHAVQLYRPPVPDADRIPLDPHMLAKEWTRFGTATVRLKIFLNEPRPESTDESEDELADTEGELPEVT